jgi:C_GCAxxG_C_C family probable redox protein
MNEMRITQFPEEFKKIAEKLALTYGPKYHGCAQVVVAPLMEILGIQDEMVLMAASCFAAGSKRCLTCGALSGGLMVLGLKYGRRRLEDGVEAEEAALEPACDLIDRFKEEYETTDCCELTGYYLGDPSQFQAFLDSPEALEKCDEKVKNVAGWVAEIISKRDGISGQQS